MNGPKVLPLAGNCYSTEGREDGLEFPDELVELRKVIPYEKNTLVLFPHSADSVHGVSTRSAATCPRRHVNFVAEVETNVYEIEQYPTLNVTEAD